MGSDFRVGNRSQQRLLNLNAADEKKPAAQQQGPQQPQKTQQPFNPLNLFKDVFDFTKGKPVGPSISQEVKAGNGKAGGSVKVEVGTKVSTTDVKDKPGYVQVTGTVSASVNAKGNIDLKKVSIGVSVEAGASTGYSLQIKKEDLQAALAKGQVPNPFDPDSLPVGSTATLDGKTYSKTELKAAYEALSVKLGYGKSEETSIAVEKTGPNTVRVIAGKTDSVQSQVEVGLGYKGASATIGNTRSLKDGKTMSAEFDLSTKEGRAAYDNFLATGDVKSGPGVSHLTTTEKTTLSSETKLNVALGPIKLGTEAGANATLTSVTQEDGSFTSTLDGNSGAGSSKVERSFDKDGKEDVSQTKTTLTFPTLDKDSSRVLEEMLTGKPAEGKGTPSLTFDAKQAEQLRQLAKDYVATHPNDLGHPFITALAESEGSANVALAAAMEKSQGPGALVQGDLLALFGNGTVKPGEKTYPPLPGSFSVEGQDAKKA